MLKSITATILAGTIAVTGMSATPAQAADNEELARLLFGLATVGIIASALHDQNGNNSGEPAYTHTSRNQPRVIEGDVIRHQRYQGQRYNRKVVPATCIRQVRKSNGRTTRVFGQRCLERNGVNTARLPNRCERFVQTSNRSFTAWNRRCLLDQGYRIQG